MRRRVFYAAAAIPLVLNHFCRDQCGAATVCSCARRRRMRRETDQQGLIFETNDSRPVQCRPQVLQVPARSRRGSQAASATKDRTLGAWWMRQVHDEPNLHCTSRRRVTGVCRNSQDQGGRLRTLHCTHLESRYPSGATTLQQADQGRHRAGRLAQGGNQNRRFTN